MPHTNLSNFIPRSTSLPVYDIPSFTNTNPFLAQAYTIEQLMYYEYLLQQPFMRALMMSDPALALLVARNISAASLANPFGVPMLNPSMLYSPSLTSRDINLLPGAVNNTPEMHTVSASSPLTAEDVASEGERTFMSQVAGEQEKNKNDLLMGASSNMVNAEVYSQSDSYDTAKSCGMESNSGVIVESTYENEDKEPYSSSDEIYRYVDLCAVKGTKFTINVAILKLCSSR
jgi:hypothetical protein